MQAYLFVHFREKTTPDGEQVYFGLSRDGLHWESVNDGQFYILATDLSLSYGMRNQYQHSWEQIARIGSKCLSLWESEDLVNWSEQRLIEVGNEKFGCVWAPDIIYDQKQEEYVLHWTSSHAEDDYQFKSIYYSRTSDFHTFTKPEILYREEEVELIDSAMYEEEGRFYLFVKRGTSDSRLQLLESENITGPFTLNEEFSRRMEDLEEGKYEAPTAVKLADGRWSLYLDYYGAPGAKQGYVPFLSENLKSGKFVRSENEISFPYGFKHGTILPISEEEYDRIKQHDWTDKGWI